MTKNNQETRIESGSYIYIVREAVQTSTPQEQGPVLARFKSYSDAREYSAALYLKKEIQSYISKFNPTL